ncbi:fimbrial biogenesis chaperone [Caballeronia sp. HLA56]
MFAYLLAADGVDAAIVLSGTRLVFEGAKRETSITAENRSDEPYVVQAWIEDDSGNTDTPFFVVPAVSRIDGRREGLLRVVKVGGGLPSDRESMYWLNVKEIPRIDKRDNVLQISVRTRIKLFYRPPGLHQDKLDTSLLRWSQVRDRHLRTCSLVLRNDAPFFASFTDLTIKYGDGRRTELESGYVAPWSSREFVLPHCDADLQVSYSIINDFGATEERPAVPAAIKTRN